MRDENLKNGKTEDFVKEDVVLEEEKVETKKIKKTKTQKLEEKIDELKLEVKKLKEEKLLIAADTENYKKRINQERIIDRQYASRGLILSLLHSLDQLKLITNMKTEDDKLKNFLIGFKMISDQLFKTLEEDGLKEIEALNKPFDPNYHEAVEKVKEKSMEKGINLEVVSPGYMYKEKLLRPAMVKVNEWSDENGKDK